MIDFLKRRISAPVWAVLALALSVGALVYAVAPTHEDRDAAKVAQWMRRQTVFTCESRPGERIEWGRQEPIGPNADPNAEPVQLVIRMQGCETFFTPPPKDQNGHK